MGLVGLVEFKYRLCGLGRVNLQLKIQFEAVPSAAPFVRMLKELISVG